MTSIAIRLQLQEAEVVKRGLQSLGTDGEAALRKLERAAATAAQGGGGGGGFQLLEGSGKNLTQALRKVGEAGRLLPSELAPAVGIFSQFAGIMNPLGLAVAGVGLALSALIGGQSQSERATESATYALNAYKQALAGAKGEVEGLTAAERTRLESLGKISAEQLTQSIAAELEALPGKIKNLLAEQVFNQGDLSGLNDEFLALFDQFDEGAIKADDFRAAVAQLGAADPDLGPLVLALDKLFATVDANRGALRELGEDMKILRQAAGSLFLSLETLAGVFAGTDLASGLASLAERQAAFASGGLQQLAAVEAAQKREAAAAKEAEAATKDLVASAREKSAVYDEVYQRTLRLQEADDAFTATVHAAEEAEKLRTQAAQKGATAAAALAKEWVTLRDTADPLGKASRDLAEDLAAATAAKEAGLATDEQLLAVQAQLVKAYLDQVEPFPAILQGLREETHLAGLSADARQRATLILQAENEARQKGIELTDQQRAAIENEIEARLAADEARQAAEAAAKEAERVTSEFVDDTVDYGAKAFVGLFDGIAGDWESLWNDAYGFFKQTVARMVSEAVIRPSIEWVVQGLGGLPSIGGGSSAGGTSAIGSFFNNVGSFLGLGGGSTASLASKYPVLGTVQNFAPGVSAPLGGGFDLGGLLGSAGTGAGIGSLISGLMGRGSVGGTIGGALGGIAGSFLPFPGGSIVGSIFGSIIGSLFGKKKEAIGPRSNAEIRSEGGLELQHYGQLKGAGDPSPYAYSIIDATTNLLQALGGKLGTGKVTVDVGDIPKYGGIFVNPTGNYSGAQGPKESGTFFGKDEDAARRFAISTILSQAGVVDVDPAAAVALKKSLALRTRDEDVEKDVAALLLYFDKTGDEAKGAAAELETLNETFDEAAKRIKELGLSEAVLNQRRAEAIAELKSGFQTTIRQRILGIEDPQALALEQLDKEFDQLREDAITLGADLVEIEKLYGLERQQIVEQFAQQANDALRQLLEDTTFGQLAGLDPLDRLARLRQSYGATEAAALGGDAGARADLEAIARQFLEASLVAFNNTAAYQEDLARVRSALQQLGVTVPGFAMGTRFAPGGLALVGERGPELVNLPRGSQVIPDIAAFANDNRDWLGVLAVPLREGLRLSALMLEELRALRGAFEDLRDMVRDGSSFERRLATLKGGRA